MADILVRRALAEDGGLVRDIYARGTAEEFGARLAGAGDATSYHLAEMDGTAVAVLAITELGRLSPAAPRRLLLHEIKVRPSFRNIGVIDAVFGWLAADIGAGTDLELILLAPLQQEPAVFAEFGLHESHRVFRWPVVGQEVAA